MKNIQISEKLFYDIARYVILTDEDEVPSAELRNNVIDGITDKLQKIADRELYTQYKTAQSEEEREKARQAYLESKGIPDNFRW
ncbi:MAG: complexin-2 [Lachnospiraceae bacterium]|nr:complexin-2 [Lachnospiraceae bacterium]